MVTQPITPAPLPRRSDAARSGSPHGTEAALSGRVIWPSLLLSSMAASATPMDALLDEAWKQSPQVLRAQADLESAEAGAAGASVWLPNPEIESTFNSDAPFANQGEMDFDVGIVQELAWPGGRFANVAASESSIEAARARLAAARLSVAANVERALAGVVGARAAQETRAGLLRVARTMAEAAKRRLEAGSIGQLEATLVAADAASAESALLFAQAEVSAAEAQLCRVLGRTTCALGALEWPALVAIDTKRSKSVDERLDIRSARADKKAAERRAEAAGLAWLPSLRLGAGYAFEQSVLDAASREDDVVDPDHLLGATLSITIPVWDFRRADVLAARSQVTRADADAREAAIRASSSVSPAVAALESATAAAQTMSAVQADIAKALADLEKAYDAGAIALDEALTSRDRLLKARLDAIEANRRRVSAHADLLEALSLPLIPGVEGATEKP